MYEVRINYSMMGKHANLSWIAGYLKSYADADNVDDCNIQITKVKPLKVEERASEELL